MFLKIFLFLTLFMKSIAISSEFDDAEKYFYHEDYRSVSTQSTSILPTTQDKTLENVVVKVGQQAILPCFINNLGSHKVIWVKDGDILALGATKINSDTRLNIQHRYLSEWHLVIDNVVTDDEGEYICKTNGNFFKVINLQVLMPPTMDDFRSTPPGSQNIKEGSTLKLKCYADAKPEPLIKWYRWKKYKNFQSEKEELDVKENEIVISSIKRNDHNLYECIAKNSVPPATSRIFSLEIQFLPIVDLEIRKTFQFLNKKFSLECKIEANPIERLYWTKNGIIYDAQLNENKEINRHSERSISYESSHLRVDKYDISNENEFHKTLLILTVMNAKKHDFGEYQCCSVNQYGQICSNIMVQEIYSEATTDRHVLTKIQTSTTLSKLKSDFHLTESSGKRIISSQEDENKQNENTINLNNSSDSKDKRRHYLIKSKQFLHLESNSFNSTTKRTLNYIMSLIWILFFKNIF
ncbi:unnamed protein product [Brachionus calyciflorus]|uniref:Ig-like domain-containing protein n=1 Tax=Brachionus calyciflorus TaxID=104777 RepID=A0A813XXU9_9BILA|nr:unnamed protein product [Brachionus calyciflorus]